MRAVSRLGLSIPVLSEMGVLVCQWDLLLEGE